MLMNMNHKTQIVVKGHLDKKWKNWFGDMEISYEDDLTILTGNIRDESLMHGILNRIRDLNIKLISVNPDEKEKEAYEISK